MAGSQGSDRQPVRLAVIGLGGWGKNVVRCFAAAQGVRLTHICDSDPSKLARFGALYPQAETQPRYQAALDDPETDAVAIVTPAPSHYAIAKAALLAGKHVYVEKPLTLRSDHAEELVELSEQANRRLMVGHLFIHHPAVEFMKREVGSGRLGDIYYMYCQRLNLGVVRRDENAFWSLAPHDVSVVLHLMDSEPVEITASGQAYLQAGIEDVVMANLQFADGRMAQIHVSWLDPHKERKMVVVGSEKMLVFDDMQPAEKIRIYDKGARLRAASLAEAPSISVRHGDIQIPRISPAEPLLLETQHFVDCVREGQRPLTSGREGLAVVRVLEKVESALKLSAPTLRRAA